MYTYVIGLTVGAALGASATLTTNSSTVGASVATIAVATSFLLTDSITRAAADRIGSSIKASLQEKKAGDDLKGRLIQLATQPLIKQDLNTIAYNVLRNLDAGVKPDPVAQKIGQKLATHVMKTKFKGLLASPFRGIIHTTIARVVALAIPELSVKEAVVGMTPDILRIAATSGLANIRSRL